MSSCLTIMDNSVVMVGDAMTFLTSVWTSVEPVGEDSASDTAAAKVFSPSGVMSAAFIWPDARVSAMKRCILGVSNSSRTAFWTSTDGAPLLDPPPDELPPLDPPDDPPPDELPPLEPPEALLLPPELPC